MTVAGTNGKGTCVEAIQAMATAGGCRVGSYTSPHLWHYNERIRIDAKVVDDARIVAAFERIEVAREGDSLTYFEFGTLAAFEMFAEQPLDLWVLEVGLGGRLDAVNVVDADVAVVTSIGLDHQDWLGSDLLGIAGEKLAVGRPGKPLFAGNSVPQIALEQARQAGVQIQQIDSPRLADGDCPPALVRENLELACSALDALGLLPPNPGEVLRNLRVPGRCERHVYEQHEEIFDVAHNTDSMAHLARYLQSLPRVAPVIVVFSALGDKPIEEMTGILADAIDEWYVVGLDDPRGLSASALKARIGGAKPTALFDGFEAAMAAARGKGRRIVVCGSFLTVSAGNPRHG